MSVFLDTGKIGDIKKFVDCGLIRGVTTNPSILLKEYEENSSSYLKSLENISEIIKPYPLSIQLIETEEYKLIEEAKRYSNINDNIIVKVPIHDENGGLKNLHIINVLERVYNIRVNTTAIMSAQQVLMAGLAGASYASIFAGRINDMGYSSVIEVEMSKKLITSSKLDTKIIAASCREVYNLIEWINAGADFVTLNPSFLMKIVNHPYTKETVEMFNRDASHITKLEMV